MANTQEQPREEVVREWPKYSLWLEDNATHQGNLILTNERLIYLNRVALSQKEHEEMQELSKGATTNQVLNFALKLHKRNFQIPLSSIVSSRLGFCFILPSPRPCVRVYYQRASKKPKMASFLFRRSMLMDLFRPEFPITAIFWYRAIKKATKAKQLTG